MNHYEKSRIALYYWLLGRSWFDVARAMTDAQSRHGGLRKDGMTPAFAHQIFIANYLRTLPAISDEDMRTALIAAFFHDTPEDTGMSTSEIAQAHGSRAAGIVERLTKEYRGTRVDENTYFQALRGDPLAALVKGVDRLHNLHSMVGVFTREKQEEYLAETEKYHIPMLKVARRDYPSYEPAFENVSQALQVVANMIFAIHVAEDAAKTKGA